jgi:hypothetical protein
MVGSRARRDATLLRWNGAMALVHTGFLLTVLVIADFGVRLPVYRLNYTSAEGHDNATWVQPNAVVVDGEIPIAAVAAGFSALSALFHAANVLVWREAYLRNIQLARCPQRWAEYSLSAPLQAVAIARFAGIATGATLWAIVALVATTMFFGHLTEELARPASAMAWATGRAHRLQAHFLGYVPFGAAVALVAVEFARLAREFPQMPDFVPLIVATQGALFTSFTFVQLVATLRPPREYWQGEVAYMVLSLVSKGVLSVLLLGNVIAVTVFRDDDGASSR